MLPSIELFVSFVDGDVLGWPSLWHSHLPLQPGRSHMTQAWNGYLPTRLCAPSLLRLMYSLPCRTSPEANPNHCLGWAELHIHQSMVQFQMRRCHWYLHIQVVVWQHPNWTLVSLPPPSNFGSCCWCSWRFVPSHQNAWHTNRVVKCPPLHPAAEPTDLPSSAGSKMNLHDWKQDLQSTAVEWILNDFKIFQMKFMNLKFRKFLESWRTSLYLVIFVGLQKIQGAMLRCPTPCTQQGLGASCPAFERDYEASKCFLHLTSSNINTFWFGRSTALMWTKRIDSWVSFTVVWV